ncbi:MAG: hypothetical protein AMS24_01515 [Chlamydiae bacterium SM23_39]|nr:MAG: hypothetical protein AMS24_01515 [Chlamydiae bacterium SM23_39]
MKIKIFAIGPILTNTIFLICEKTKEMAIIDPSIGAYEKILKYEKDFSIKTILLTHSHWDHIADVFKIKKKTNALVYIHKLDSENLKKPGYDKLPSMVKIDPVEPDIYIEDKMKLFVGDIEIEVIHTPGHSPGSVCFYISKEKILFSGDTLFHGGIGRIDFPFSNPSDMQKSLKKLFKLPNDVTVIPGHGKKTTIGKSKNLIHLFDEE